MMRASTKAQTGNCVSQTSIATTPHTNMVTAKDISIYHIRSLNGRTKDENIPPIGDFLVYRHEASVDIRLFGE